MCPSGRTPQVSHTLEVPHSRLSSVQLTPNIQQLKSSPIVATSRMDANRATPSRSLLSLTDVLVKIMNFLNFLFTPREILTFRWANTRRDISNFVGEFSIAQFTKIYKRVTCKYKYHPQQRYENSIRKFDLTEALSTQMKQTGNTAFYKSLHGQTVIPNMTDYDVDLTRISDLSTVSTSADYLYREVSTRKDKEAAYAARKSYARGFSRVVDPMSYEDWQELRTELQDGRHLGAGVEDLPGDNVILVALSYKGKSVKVTRRMNLLKEDGTPEEGEGLSVQFDIQMTSDIVDDFRWSQLVRSCMAIATQRSTNKMRIWIDRLMTMGVSKEERTQIRKIVDWEEYGLFAYAVCPVVRVYDKRELLYGTDFWRKLETVLGVAGKGIVVDDYMLRKYDNTIYYGPSMYKRIGNGISSIGGTGMYLRSVTLALATAVLTDGVTVSAANEDIRTLRAASGWKAWALRTIAEGAYSRSHTSMLRREEPFVVSYREFMTIAFWESMVSRCSMLTGNSYLDMSYQQSMSWSKRSSWDGILEWVGMFRASCEIEDREDIMSFLKQNVKLSTWTSTTGHVASILTMRSADQQHKRCIVAELARFSTVRQGHVVAVAEATGLWGGSILSPYYRFQPDPDRDQRAEVVHTIQDHGVILFTYRYMKVTTLFRQAVLICAYLAVTILFFSLAKLFSLFSVVGVGLLVGGVLRLLKLNWPWRDKCDVGEAVFDNLLLHSLYNSGIKRQYRRLKGTFGEIGWN